MNGSAPKSPLTGSHAWWKKKAMPNLLIDICERNTSSVAISATIPKMVRAQPSISHLKARSLQTELPRPSRNFRTAECSGCAGVPGED